VAAISIAWVLRWQGITAAICGARKPEQLDDFIDAWKLQLTEEDVSDIASAIEKTGLCKGTSGDGPVRPVEQW